MQRIGRFTVIRELGHGGMGSVFLAKDPELERDVAIKLLHRTTAGKSSARAQFRQEALALARMSHAGIVTIFETGEHEGQQYIAMEYLRGRSLRELLLAPEAKPPRDRMLAICADVARAVAAAHARGILHRDIKPENVVVLDDGAVKVVDFGLARRLGVVSLPAAVSTDELVSTGFEQTVRMFAEATIRVDAATTAASLVSPTAAGTLFGTPAYMAPEVLGGEPANEATDVYSLGVMVYECLGGRRPYEARTLVELIATVVDGSEPPKRLADPMWPLVARMLSRDAGERPRLQEIAEQLVPSIAPAPVAPLRRKRWALVAAAAVMLAVGAVVAWRMLGSAPERISGTLAFDSYVAHVPAWGTQTARDLGPLMAQLVGRDHIPTIALAGNPIAAAPDATIVVRGGVQQIGSDAVGSLHVIDLRGRFAIVFVERGEARRLPALLGMLADRLTTWIDPDVRVGGKDPRRAKPLLARGKELLDRGDWHTSRFYLEQAVQLDPDLVDGWHAVASARAWTIAPLALTEEAIANAIRLEPDPDKRLLWIGAAHFYRDETVKALEVLAPLEARTDLALPEIDMWNYLGEAYWHDGQPERAMPYFRKLLDHKPPFLQIRLHVYDYSLWHGDLVKASQAYGLDRPGEDIDLARGDYAKLADRGPFPYDLYAQLILGRTPDPALVAKLGKRDAQLYRLAVGEAGDVGPILDELRASPTTALWEQLASFADVVLAAEHRDGIRGVLEIQRARGRQPFRGYDRRELLAAPILGQPAKIDRDTLASRDRKLATAIEAEVAGDRATAVAVLDELLKDPANNWDILERAALVRNLAALGRRDALIAACKVILKPPIFRWSWIPLARACRKHVR